MYSPSKRRFKRVISMNSGPESPDVNLPTEKDHRLTDESEHSDWNEHPDDAVSQNDSPSNVAAVSSASSEEQERDNPIIIPDSSSIESSESFVDALEYPPDEEPIEDDLVSLNSADDFLFELPANLSIEDRVENWLNENAPERDALFKPKPGKKRQADFVSPPNGELQHPYLEWQLDKASMDKYMWEYAKQEGFAVNPEKEHKGSVIRWRCMYAGKYKNHRNLSAEVGTQDIPLDDGTSPSIFTKNRVRPTSTKKTRQ